MPGHNLAIFASTRGTDLQAVIDAKRTGKLPHITVSFVLSNKSDAFALTRAQQAGIKTIFLDPKGKTREEYDAACLTQCQEHGVDIILLIGYMRIMTPVIIAPYRNRILNIHPSLLPKYPGMDLDVHQEVLRAGESETGCTLHIVDESLDGGPTLAQAKVRIDKGETPESLKAKVQQKEQEVIVDTLVKVQDVELEELVREWQIKNHAYAAHS